MRDAWLNVCDTNLPNGPMSQDEIMRAMMVLYPDQETQTKLNKFRKTILDEMVNSNYLIFNENKYSIA